MSSRIPRGRRVLLPHPPLVAHTPGAARRAYCVFPPTIPVRASGRLRAGRTGNKIEFGVNNGCGIASPAGHSIT